jgi:hypothetical protein
MRVIGSDRLLLAACPAQQSKQEKGAYRMALFFDVTQIAKGFDPRGLMRMPGRWALQRPSLPLAGRAEEFFQPAATVPSLQPEDRMVVVTIGTETHVYPADLLAVVAGATDMVGGRRVFVAWNPVTQLASCLEAKMEDKPIDWQDSGLLYRGNEVLFDGGTGSLWDPATGAALTGPMSDRATQVLPVQVCLWGQWKAAHPDASILNPPGINLDPATTKRIETYLASPVVPVPLAQSGPGPSPLPAKAFVLGLSAGDQSRAYDLGALFAAGTKSLKDTVGTQDFEITITSPRAATATSGGAPVNSSVMLWFGWKELHPKTTVYGQTAEAPPVNP